MFHYTWKLFKFQQFMYNKNKCVINIISYFKINGLNKLFYVLAMAFALIFDIVSLKETIVYQYVIITTF